VTVNPGGVLTGTGTVSGLVNLNQSSATSAVGGMITSGSPATGATGILTTGIGTSTALPSVANLAVPILAISESGTVVTVIASGSYTIGQAITIAGVAPAGFSIAAAVTGLVPGGFTYTAAAGLGTATMTNATVTAAAPITAATEVGNTVTVVANGAYMTGQVVNIAGLVPAGFNGTYQITGTAPAPSLAGTVGAGTNSTTQLQLQAGTFNTITPNFYQGETLTFTGGPGAGQIVVITASTTAGVLTFAAQTTAPAAGTTTYTVAGNTFTYTNPVSGLGTATVAGATGPNVTQAPGIVAITLNGITAGAGYDQIDVNGGIVLTNSQLQLTLAPGFTPLSGSSYTIINNLRGSDQTVGNFIGLPEGSFITANGFAFKITYVGGDGNDVVLNYTAGTAVAITDTETATNPPAGVAPAGTAVPGSTITYTVIATNTGNNPVSTTVADVLPTGITSDNYTVITTAGVTGASGGSGNVNQTINLPVGGSATYTIIANIASGAVAQIGGTTLSDTATATFTVGATPTASSSTATVTLTPESDLAVTNTASVASDIAGNPVTYTIVVNNPGPSDATNATVVDNFPTGGAFGNMTYSYTASYTGGATDSTLGAGTGSGNINDTITMPAGGTITYTVVASVPANATATSVSDTVTVNTPAGNTDPNTTNNTATATYILQGPPDLQITNTVGQSAYPAGSPLPPNYPAVSYTIIVTDAGPSTASGAVVSDTFPAVLTNVSWTATDGDSGAGAISDTVTLTSGSSVTYTVTGSIPSSASTGPMIDTATVSAAAGLTDPNLANNTATATSSVVNIADLQITNTDGATTSLPQGGTDTYTVIVTNAGPTDVAGANVTDNLPAAFTSQSWTATSSAGVTGVSASGSGNVNDTVNMVSGSTITYTIVGSVSPTATGTVTTTATVTAPAGATDPNTSNNVASDSNTIVVPTVSDVQLTDNFTQNPEAAGTTVTYTIVASNAGPSVASGAVVSDTVPATLTGVSWSGDDGHFGTGALSDTVTLGSGSNVTYTVTGLLPASATGTLTDTATATAGTSSDPNAANNTATATAAISTVADLQISNTSTATVIAGASDTYTVIVTNNGPSNVTGATVADSIETKLANVSWSASNGDSASGQINDTITLNSGASVTYTVTGTVGVTSTGTLSSTATVTAPSGATDSNTSNNVANFTQTISNTNADVQVTDAFSQTSFAAGTGVTYIIVATNAGPTTASGAVVSDMVPASLTGVSWSGSDGNSGTGALSDTVTLSSGSSVTYIVTGSLSSSATGTLTDTVTASPGSATDPNAANNTATATAAIAILADLQITNSDGAVTSVAQGATDTYTVVVTNAGPSDVTGAAVSDAMPAGFSGMNWTATSSPGVSGVSASGSGSINDTVNVPANGTITYTVIGTVAASATGTVTTTASVTAPSGATDPNTSNNVASDSNTIIPATVADLQITDTFSQTAYPAGSPAAGYPVVSYTIVVTDAGPSAVTGVTVSDAVSGSLSNVSWSASNGDSGTGTVSDTLTLSSGGSVTYTVTGSIPSSAAAGPLSDTATLAVPGSVNDPNSANNTATATSSITNVADLQIVNHDGHTSVNAGATDTYTVVVTNAGPSDVTGANISDVFPSVFTNVSWSASNGHSGAGNVSDTVNMVTGSTITYTVTGTVSNSATGSLTSTATVTAPSGATDPNTSNNVANDTDTVVPLATVADLQVTDTFTQSAYPAGSPQAPNYPAPVYTIVVTNAGPQAATGAVVSDALSGSLSNVSWSASNGDFGTGPVSDTITLASGASVTYTVTGSIASSAATGALSDTASVAAPGGVTDPNTANNSATATSSITQVADLQIAEGGFSTVTAGTADSFVVVVTNTGPSDVTGAAVTETADNKLSNVSWTASNGDSGTGNISDTINLTSGNSVTYTVTGTVNPAATGTLSSTSTVAGAPGESDPDTTNNAASFTQTINNTTADVQVTDAFSQTSYAAGTNVMYTIVASNAGPSTTSGVVVSDTPSAALTGVTWTGSDGSSGVGAISDTTTLASGGSVTYTVNATLPSSATGSLADTATASAGTGFDPNSTNNTATATAAITTVADLQITNTGSGTIAAGATDTYTVVVTNAGTSDVTGATVADTISSKLTGVTWTGTDGHSGSGNVSDTFSLASGGTVTYTVIGTVMPTATGTVVTTATVTAPSGATDPNTSNNVATATDTIAAATTDLQVTDNFAQGSYPAGSPQLPTYPGVTYTIVATNAGAQTVTGAVVSEAAGAALTNEHWTASNGDSGAGAILDTITIANGASVTYTVTGAIPSSAAAGTLSDTATITSPATVADTNTTNNTATATTTITNVADLQITNTDGVSSVNSGATDTYTVVVTNSGPSDASGATITDNFPGIFTNTSWTATSSAGVTGVTATGSGNIGDTVYIPTGATITYTITGTVSPSATGTLTNVAQVTRPLGSTDPNTSNNMASDSDTIVSTQTPVDLSVVVSDNKGGTTSNGSTSGGTTTVNSVVVYTIVVTNNSSSNAVNGVSIVDILQSNFFSGTPSYTVVTNGGAAVSTGGASPTNGNIQENAANMPALSTITYMLTGTVSGSASNFVFDSASVNVPKGFTDPNTNNNTSSDTITIPGAVNNSIISSPAAAPGNTITFTDVVTNDGTSGVTGATVSFPVPAGLTGVSSINMTNGGAAITASNGTGGAILDTVNLPAGATITYSITGTVSHAAAGTLTATSSASTPGSVVNLDATAGSTNTNVSSDGVSLTPTADLYVSIQGSDDVSVGGVDVYTIVVTNNGPSDVTGASLSDVFSNLTGVSYTSNALYNRTGYAAPTASSPSGTLAGAGATLNESLNMSAGSIMEFTVTGTIASGAPATLSNTVTVADPAGTTDPNTVDNSATVSAAVNAIGGSVVGRSIFYPNSFYDGNNAGAPTTADFSAIATDKVPLLPGQTATYSNVSDFAAGIDGIFIDMTGIPNLANITAADFAFNVGNNNTPGTGTAPGAGWSTLATAPTVTTFAGMGVNGSDRIALTWPAGTIVGTWLQVTVRGNSGATPDVNTGLATPDVFYFGSAPGDSGNSTTDFRVNATDEANARNDSHTFFARAPIADPNDYNRDSFVNGNDESTARANSTTFLTALQVITVPGLPNNQGVSSPASSSSVSSLSSLSTSSSNTATVGTLARVQATAPVLLPPVIQVGNYQLKANTPNQKIQIFVSGDRLVQGTNVEVQIGDGGAAFGGQSGPVITSVDVLHGTIFATNNSGQSGTGSIVPQIFEATTTTKVGAVLASGLLATITVDTTGFNGGSFPLLLSGTLNGNTDFAGIAARVNNGSITIIPPPPPKGSISGNVFSDTNGDGKQQAHEAGLGGWTVDIEQLVNGKEVVVATAVTDKNGHFDAKNLKAGVYEVEVVNHPKKFKPTGKSATGYRVALGPGENATGFNFGEKPIA
jgi:uncharacterized repeat protein (TIGR01451 family)